MIMGVQTATGALGLGASIFQTIQGAKEKKEAERALADYDRQKLVNATEGLQVSTLGSQLQREEQARNASTQVGALQEAGSRSLIGGLGRVSSNNNLVNQQIGAGLDQQQANINQMRAEDDARIRGMQENREIADISALSSQVQSGKNDMYAGIGNGLQSIGMIGNSFGGASGAMTDLGGSATAPTATQVASKTNSYNPQEAFNFSPQGTGLFKQPTMPQVGYGKTPIGYDLTGQPLYK